MDCKCSFVKTDKKWLEQYELVLRRIREQLMSYEEGAVALKTKPKLLEYHIRRHEENINARILEKLIVVLKSDLLENYNTLQKTFRLIERSGDQGDITNKIKLSVEIRALKRDINDFIKEHSTRLARDHQNLENQWNRMQDFLLYDACKSCKIALSRVLREDKE